MSFPCSLEVDAALPEPLTGTFSAPERCKEGAEEPTSLHSSSSSFALDLGGSSSSSGRPLSFLEFFLHRAPVRCIESVARYLDFPSFTSLLTLNSSLLRLCDSPALQPCWTHFALVQRVLRHGENVLLPRLSPSTLPLLPPCSVNSGGRGGCRRNRCEGTEAVTPCQTFSRLLPRVTRLDFVRIGSLNSNWRTQSFSSEKRQVIVSSEALDRAYVLPAPPFQSSFLDYSVAPDAQVSLQGWPSVGLPACMRPSSASRGPADGLPLFTVLPNARVFAVHAAAGFSRGQSVEIKVPLLPTRIPADPNPLIGFGGHAPKGWLLGEEDAPNRGALESSSVGAGGRGLGVRMAQSQRKRQRRQQRQQQLHRLHMSWVHLAPHPLQPSFPRDEGKAEAKKVFKDGTLFRAPAFSGIGTVGSSLPLSTGTGLSDAGDRCQAAPDAAPGEGLGHCPQVRLLCLCLPAIEIERGSSPAGLASPGSAQAAPGGGLEKHGFPPATGTAESAAATQHIRQDAAADTASARCCGGSSAERLPGTPVVKTSAACASATSCAADDEHHSCSTARGAPVASLPTTPKAAGHFHRTVAPRCVWPVALCSYSPKGARFLAHAIVCCALRQGEAVKSARSRLWFKDKNRSQATKPRAKETGSTPDELQQQTTCGAASSGRTYGNVPGSSGCSSCGATSGKSLSFSLQQHPLAVFVGVVAVGTTGGRIFCTQPPRCLLRRCYCGACICASGEAHRGLSLRGLNSEPLDAHCDAESKPGFVPPKLRADLGGRDAGSSSSGSLDLSATASRAGRGVSFFEVGHFGEAGGVVDYVEIVRGTPWASRAQQQKGQSRCLVLSQQRDYAWHWTRPPAAATARPRAASACGSRCCCFGGDGAHCGGVEAEALWLFACSREAGIKVFRFMWNLAGKSHKREEAHGAWGEWRCVFTVRGKCDLVSLDINSGIMGVCTPLEPRVSFLAFWHLLPSHIYLSSSAEAPGISAEALKHFAHCGLPRPMEIPFGGFLATQQEGLVVQAPPQCSRAEFMVPRRPSFVVPLGGRRFAVIDGSVIRVVQVNLKKKAAADAAAAAAAPAAPPATGQAADVPRRDQGLTQAPSRFRLHPEPLRPLHDMLAVEPLAPWKTEPPEAPEVEATRLCAFSHTRWIYQCAFDGVRRLVTVDLREVLMIWDLQRCTKLFDIDLMAGGGSRSRRSLTGEMSGTDELEGDNGADMGLSSDGIDTEQERELMRRHACQGGDSDEMGLGGGRAVRKAGRLSLKKQFGRGWMQREILAHRGGAKQQLLQQQRAQASPVLHASREGPNPASLHAADGTSVGGVWFPSSALEPSLQLQLLYDSHREVLSSGQQQPAKGGSTRQHQAARTGNSGAAAGSSGTAPGVGQQQELRGNANVRETASGEAGDRDADSLKRKDSAEDAGKIEDPRATGSERTGFFERTVEATEDAEAATASAVSYAADFPPLSSPAGSVRPGERERALLQTLSQEDSRGFTNPWLRVPAERRGATDARQDEPVLPGRGAVRSMRESDNRASRGDADLQPFSDQGAETEANVLPEEVPRAKSGSYNRTKSRSRNSTPVADVPPIRPPVAGGLAEASCSAAEGARQVVGEPPIKGWGLADSGLSAEGARPSFAAVAAAAAAASGGSCQRTGWASGPTNLSWLIGIVGEDSARALQEAASALGTTTEELYIQQLVQWDQLQQRGLCKSGHGEHERLARGSCSDLACTQHSRKESQQQASPAGNPVDKGLQNREQLTTAEANESEGELLRGSEASGSPVGGALVGSPSLDASQPLHAGTTFQRLPATVNSHNFRSHLRSSMVGLLGRQRCMARLGPNAQQRHVAAVCLSETCMALLFKNLKTWQIWEFAPAATATAAENTETSTECMS